VEKNGVDILAPTSYGNLVPITCTIMCEWLNLHFLKDIVNSFYLTRTCNLLCT